MCFSKLYDFRRLIASLMHYSHKTVLVIRLIIFIIYFLSCFGIYCSNSFTFYVLFSMWIKTEFFFSEFIYPEDYRGLSDVWKKLSLRIIKLQFSVCKTLSLWAAVNIYSLCISFVLMPVHRVLFSISSW